MRITDWSIKHGVTIFVLLGVITLGGLMAYQGLPREAAPDITIPYVLVTTPYIGVSPADIETLITNPIEEELEQLKDVREIRSTSAEGASIISIEFEPGVNIDNSLTLVRERVALAKPQLPDDAEEPIVTEISFSEWPIMVVNVAGDVGLLRLKRVAEELQGRIERIPGVLEVSLVGGLDREITVEADPDLLEYYRVSLNEVVAAIQRENVNIPGGTLELGGLNYSVRVPGEFETVEQINDLVVRQTEGGAIYVRDVARVIDGYEQQATYSRLNGLESVSLSITRRAGENIPLIAQRIKDLVAQFEEANEGRIAFTVLADVSRHIDERVFELENNIITGLLLVIAVLLFFMGGFRNALFVAIAIPGSMLITFGILAALGITLNIVVLFSLVLALGMLVDNAIVIVENIYRHATMGKSNWVAASDGVKEVAWPVIASTATTVFAFFPMLFWPGIMGGFMMYLPLTVIIVLCSSLFVALVINPVICSRLLRVKKRDVGPLPEGPQGEIDALPNNLLYRAYRATLAFSLRRRWVVGLGVLGAFVGTFMMYGRMNAGVEFFPHTTPEEFYINVRLPDGSNLDASDEIVRHIEQVLGGLANVEVSVADVGAGSGDQASFGSGGTAPHRSRLTVDLLPPEEQVENAFDTIHQVRLATAGLVGAEVEIQTEGMGPPTGAPINLEIVGNDYERVGQVAQDLRLLIREINGIVNLRDDYEAGRPEITVLPDRAAASLLGISTRDIATTVRTAVNGTEASKFRDQVDEYDIIVKLPRERRSSLEDIERLMLRTSSGELVRLTEVATVRVDRGYGSIRHVDGDRVVTLSADVVPGVNEAAVLQAVQRRIGEAYAAPAGIDVRYTGQNRDQAEAQQFLGQALLAALFLIALILVTQFNSLLQPFIILASVILSLLGVLWVLMLRQMPFNIIMTGVGIISLAGVVVNNAIVLIDYINQLKARGMASRDAILAAGLVRFRPVMLTAITTVLSLLPIVLGFSLNARTGEIVWGGTSVEMWGPMANAVVGGLIVATALTLVVVPVLYSTIDSLKALFSFRRLRSRRAGVTGETGGAPTLSDSYDGDPQPAGAE
jgi:multidrug efflux pump